jgi:hypothetical protein
MGEKREIWGTFSFISHAIKHNSFNLNEKLLRKTVTQFPDI